MLRQVEPYDKRITPRRLNRQKRIFLLAIAVSLFFLALIARLAWLQWLPHLPKSEMGDHYKYRSVHQRERAIILDSGRADFLDRTGQPLTGKTVMVLAAFPMGKQERGDSAAVQQLAEVLGTTPARLSQWLADAKEPEFWRTSDSRLLPYALSAQQVSQLQQIELEGVRVLPYRLRYSGSFAAQHAIGYISQHPERIQAIYSQELLLGSRKKNELIGGAGLERSLDTLLRGIGATSVSHFTDGRNRAMHGLNVRIVKPNNPYYPLQVVTTLDLELQEQLHSYLQEAGLQQGAVVVLDTATADIRAMISVPSMNPYSLNSDLEMRNRALEAYTPGSIFKLVTEAAALEYAAVAEQEHFHCDGEYGKYGLSCWKSGGHGTLSLDEALAQSCNIAFAALGERLTAQQLQDTAERLGIGSQVGWHTEEKFQPLGAPLRLLEEEQGGRVFTALPQTRDGGLLAQTAIGQRDTAITPLQAANLVVTLLHGGRVLAPRLVSEIRYANGQRMIQLPAQEAPAVRGRVSPATAQALLRGMLAVVDHGTGRTIREGAWTVAGKSGTAQALVHGRPRNHQWFVGYGPTAAPRYAVAVLAENRSPGSVNQATKLFRGVMDIIAAHEKSRRSHD